MSVTATWTHSTAVDTALSIDLGELFGLTVTLDVTSLTGGGVTFEASQDGVTWIAYALNATDPTGSPSSTASITASSAWAATLFGFVSFRVLLSTAITGSGQVVVTITSTVSGPFNVLSYGAQGVGGDDSAAILAAISAAEANGGGTVYFPAGNYGTSQILPVTTPNVTLTGDGTASRITPLDSFFVVSIAGSSLAGTFTLTLGSDTTGNIAYDATAAAVASALSTAGITATCTGGPLPAPVFITVASNTDQLSGTFSVTGTNLYTYAGNSGCVSIQANGCRVEALNIIPSSETYADNPACDGVQLVGAVSAFTMLQVNALNLNGWVLSNIIVYQSASPVRLPPLPRQRYPRCRAAWATEASRSSATHLLRETRPLLNSPICR
jgi:hypothetical protein